MSGNGEVKRPYMGRVEFDGDDPDLQDKLRALEHRARVFGSDVVTVAYRGMPVQAFVGTNHPHQYEVDNTEDLRR